MEGERDLEGFRALKDRPEEPVVEVAAPDVAVDTCSFEAVFTDRAFQFRQRRCPEPRSVARRTRRDGLDVAAPPPRDGRSCHGRGPRLRPHRVALSRERSAERTCTSIPAASMSASRPSPISHN